jgi:hypothetical protein
MNQVQRRWSSLAIYPLLPVDSGSMPEGKQHEKNFAFTIDIRSQF